VQQACSNIANKHASNHSTHTAVSSVVAVAAAVAATVAAAVLSILLKDEQCSNAHRVSHNRVSVAVQAYRETASTPGGGGGGVPTGKLPVPPIALVPAVAVVEGPKIGNGVVRCCPCCCCCCVEYRGMLLVEAE
jgi:hypothetical protein